jgi:HEAT repeat protein
MKSSVFLCVLLGYAAYSHAELNTLEDRPYQPAASVVKGTIAALSDSSEEVVVLAVRSLADWREASAAADIVKLLAPTTPESVRMEALQYFARLGVQAKPYLTEVLKCVRDPDPNIRFAMLHVVLEAQATAENVNAIRPLLDESRSDVRALAAKCLGQAGQAAMPHRKALLDALASSGSPEFRAEALRALARIGGTTVDQIDAIIPLLRDRDAEVRIAAWAAVWNGITSAKAAGTLTDEKFEEYRKSLPGQFESEPAEVEAAIIEEIGKIKGVARLSVPNLVKRIKSSESETKAAALRVLGKAGDAALDQIPLIVSQAKDGDSNVRAAAIAALGSIGAAGVTPNFELVANALRDPSELVRIEALLALPAAGDALAHFPYKIRDAYVAADPPVRATLVKALPIILRGRSMNAEVIAHASAAFADTNADVRIGMAYVLGQLGGKGDDPLLPGLLSLTKDPEPSVRGAAAIALRAYANDGATKKQFREVLRPLLKDHDAHVRWAALDTLHEVDPAKEPALLAEIGALLNDEDKPVREAAVRTLGAAGAAAKPHLAEIIRFFNDDPAVPPYAAVQTVLQLSPLTPQEIASLLYPLYVNAELAPLTRLTAYGASGGERDDLLIIRLLGRTRDPVRDVIAKNGEAHATALLQDALKAPLLHEKLKAEITARLTELKALR